MPFHIFQIQNNTLVFFLPSKNDVRAFIIKVREFDFCNFQLFNEKLNIKINRFDSSKVNTFKNKDNSTVNEKINC